MIYFAFFIIELVLLFLLSKKLISSIAEIVFKITHSYKAVVSFLAILFLPGTIVHELAHLLTAGVMFVPVGEIELIPEVQGNNVKLGSVQIAKTDPFRRTIIGVAPVLVGISIILGILYFTQVYFSSSTPFWQVALIVYLIFEVCNTMFSSEKDMEGVIGFVLSLVIVGVLILVILALFGYSPLDSIYNWVSRFDFTSVENLFKVGSLYLLVPIIINILIVVFALPFTKK